MFDNYERNCEAMGRPLSIPEAIAIDSVNDSFSMKPNKLANKLKSVVCEKLLGDTKTPLLTDGGSAALVPGGGKAPIRLGDGRRIVWNSHDSLDMDMEPDYNGDTKPEKPTAGIEVERSSSSNGITAGSDTPEKARVDSMIKSVGMQPMDGARSNQEVREWYVTAASRIRDAIPANLPMDQRARMAFDMRNELRTYARDHMADTGTRKRLDIKSPNVAFEEKIMQKMDGKHMTYEEALEDIFLTATKTNEKVNLMMGISTDMEGRKS